MAEASDTQGILYQNLLDAGCGADTIAQCMDLAKAKERAKLLRILVCHRQGLLDTVHQNEKRIDCLDYLIYRMEKHEM